MNLIILAAGKGTRLKSLTKKIPKILVPINEEKCILDYHLDYFNSIKPLSAIKLVTGFGHDHISEFLKEKNLKGAIKLYFNPFYGFSGPLGSVWTILKAIKKKDFILCNGDTVFDVSLVQQLIKEKGDGIFLGIDAVKNIEKDDMKLNMKNGHVAKVSKLISIPETEAISTGMLMVKGEHQIRKFKEAVFSLVINEAHLIKNTPWHEIVNELIRRNQLVKAVDLSNSKWHEVDTSQDIADYRRTAGV
jgi:choline kinase